MLIMFTDALSDLEDMAAAASWMDDALCAQTDPEVFFPPEHANEGWSARAEKVCAGCPVIAECDTYALRHEISFGVWGGRRRDGSDAAEIDLRAA